MHLHLLVLCWWLSGTAGARVTGSSLGPRRLRSISLADAATAATSPIETQGVVTLSGSEKLRKKVPTEEFHSPVEEPRQGVTRDTKEPQREELTNSSDAGQLAGVPEPDTECVMSIDKMASVMMKKNIGSHKIKESEKDQYLNNGWHVVDKEQPGAVKIMCGDKESYIGLMDHCLLWKDGKPTLKKEEEVTAMLRSAEYANTSPGPKGQKVSCDYMRVFYIAPMPKVIPENGMGKDKGKKGPTFPWDIPGITWKIRPQEPKKDKEQVKIQRVTDKQDKGGDTESDGRPPALKRECPEPSVPIRPWQVTIPGRSK